MSLKEKFLEKEHGLLTMIKDEGGNLSAGERQLVCIARAILRVYLKFVESFEYCVCATIGQQNYSH